MPLKRPFQDDYIVTLPSLLASMNEIDGGEGGGGGGQPTVRLEGVGRTKWPTGHVSILETPLRLPTDGMVAAGLLRAVELVEGGGRTCGQRGDAGRFNAWGWTGRRDG